jgi:hypothetical protein
MLPVLAIAANDDTATQLDMIKIARILIFITSLTFAQTVETQKSIEPQQRHSCGWGSTFDCVDLGVHR